MRSLPAPVIAALLATASAGFGTHAAEVVIYRCTDASGRIALRDTPCHRGEIQEIRTLQRPTDPPLRPAPASAPASPSPPPREAVVYRTPPRPMYECVMPDGERYFSDTAEGNPRWVPLWTLGYPVLPPRTSLGNRIGASPPKPPGDRPGPPRPSPPYAIHSYPAGTWVRDECHAMPQQEVCARLRDRRWELDRRYNSALQSERRSIDEEQRGIDARLADDCRIP